MYVWHGNLLCCIVTSQVKMTPSDITERKLDEIFISAHQKLSLVFIAARSHSSTSFPFFANLRQNHTTFAGIANYLQPFLWRICAAFTVHFRVLRVESSKHSSQVLIANVILLWALFTGNSSTFLWTIQQESRYLSALMRLHCYFFWVSGVFTLILGANDANVYIGIRAHSLVINLFA